MKLVCLVLLYVNVIKIIWSGLFLYFIYFINGEINFNIERRDCLFVIMNVVIGIYNFVIMNISCLEDEGIYFCFVLVSIFE